jgi:23S rRNA (cytidine1920-2'-O)/16S rRNA (cytidine1409-2'-O)-methyltransferase
VSRAGLKLDAALAHCRFDVTGLTALDVGQSTGGFTEVLLARGVKHVVGVDVGNGQLHHTLRAHAQVTAIEGANARALTREVLGDAMPAAGFDVVVADLSFIPLTTVLPALMPLLAERGTLLALVKPQFELQPKDIGKGGLVKSGASYAEVERKLRGVCTELQLDVLDWFDSAITGGDGNREFFVRAQPRRPE